MSCPATKVSGPSWELNLGPSELLVEDVLYQAKPSLTLVRVRVRERVRVRVREGEGESEGG